MRQVVLPKPPGKVDVTDTKSTSMKYVINTFPKNNTFMVYAGITSVLVYIKV